MAGVVRIVSPVDGSVVAERSLASPAEVQGALTGARAALETWRHVPVHERVHAVSGFVDALVAMGDEIVPELALQMGRPVRHGPGELRGFEERARHMLDIAPDALEPVRPAHRPGFERYIVREPLGVVLVVAPWNYPLLTAVNSIVPALVAGNVVLLKHASQTLLVGERLQRAADASGLPEGVFQHLVLDHGQVSALLAAGDVDHVNLTGSVAAGQSIERAVAGTFTGVGLELGGKDPAYVRHDADLDLAVEQIVDGAFYNSGQSCCGIERVYVVRSLFDEFVERAAALARTYVLADPLHPSTTIGPMVHGAAADAVRAQVAAARGAGARVVVGGVEGEPERDRPGSPYLSPEILVGVDHDMALMREESFGPVVGVMPVDGDDDAVALMNDSPYGLTASIWTRDVEAVRALGPRLATGTVFMNRADYLDPALAWTGVKETGRGVTLSRLGLEALTRAKSYHLRLDTDQ